MRLGLPCNLFANDDLAAGDDAAADHAKAAFIEGMPDALAIQFLEKYEPIGRRELVGHGGRL